MYGISANFAYNDTFSSNNFALNSEYGVFFSNSSQETATLNNVSNNIKYGFVIINNSYTELSDNDIKSNYLGGIMANNSYSLEISSNRIYENNYFGIHIFETNISSIFTNILESQTKNIIFEGSSNNSFYSNTLSGGDYGVFLDSISPINMIYDNWFNNTINAYDISAGNYWNITADLRENILGENTTGGNYWSDYAGADDGSDGRTAGDGIGDTNLPYNSSNNITNGGDYLPLVEVHRTITIASLIVNSSDPSNGPEGDLTCWANVSNDNPGNVTLNGFWYKNGVKQFDSVYTNFSQDMPNSGADKIAMDSQEDLIITGIRNFDPGWGYWLLKYNSSLQLLWNISVGGSTINYSYPFDITVDSQDNAIITGMIITSSVTDIYNVWAAKYNSSGYNVWNLSIGGTGYDRGYGVAVDSQDNVIIAGYTDSFGAGNEDVWLIKLNSSGFQLWNKTFGGTGRDYGYGVAVDSQDNIVITGSYNWRIWTIKTNSSGSQTWNKTLSLNSNTHGNDIAVDSFNNVVVTGTSESPDYALLAIKYDKYGNELWSKIMGGSNIDSGEGVAVDSQNNIAITGYTRSSGAGLDDVWTILLDKNGNQLWDNTIGTSSADEGYGIAVDSRDNLFVAGKMSTIILVKYFTDFYLADQIPGQIINVSKMPSSSLDFGERWSCEVRAFDGQNYSIYKTSNILTLRSQSFISGGAGGRGACISSWSCEEYSECKDGFKERTCSDNQGCFFSNNLPSNCKSSGLAKCLQKVSCGEANETVEEEKPVEEKPVEGGITCSENWQCEYGLCQEDYLEYPENCIDINNCGTSYDFPEPRECDCIPVLECGGWGECIAQYDVENVIADNVTGLKGVQERTCNDNAFCLTEPRIEYQECDAGIPIDIQSLNIENESYWGIYEEGSDELISALQESEDLSQIDVTFISGGFFKTGYAKHCYNKIQDSDEEGMDCGGALCFECTIDYKDNLLLIKIAISLAVVFMGILSYLLLNLAKYSLKFKSRMPSA